MESYNQPWTVVNKCEQYQSEPKTYEYYGQEEKKHCKPEYCGKWTEQYHNKGEKPQQYGNWERPHQYGNWEKPEQYGKWEKPEQYAKWEKPEQYGNWEKTEQYGKWERPQQYGKWEKTQQYGKWEKPEQWSKWEKNEEGSKQWKNMESICGEWEKVCENLERCQLERQGEEKQHWRCEGNKCCDEEMVVLIKRLINILIGAEQSYIQLGFLCMDEKLTLVNTAEYFRLCGLRMRWLANGLIKRSVRLFNVNEWINNSTFENWFKVPSKEELATNDYTSVIKTFFKISMEAEHRLVEQMNLLGEKIVKSDWVNTQCRFEGCKWFVNFVLPYQVQFVREMNGHWRNIEMCNNGFIFDKCEMRPLVQKIEEFIHQITKVINHTGMPVWEKDMIPLNKKW